MKKALILTVGLFVLNAINVWALSIDNVSVTGTDSTSGAVTVSATVSGASAQGAMATYQVTSADGLTRRYFYPTQVSGTSWSSSEWVPYFIGTFVVEITAFDNNHQSPPVTASTTVTVTRTVSGTINSIKYSTAPYNNAGVWNNVDTSLVKLHDIGLSTDFAGVGSVGCNLLNANPGDTSQMSEEQRDIAYTDTVGYKPAGTPYRFNVTLHARPRSFMGMGEVKRWVWTPADTNAPDGPGQLEIDITSCSPWRSTYATNLQSHVGFAPLFAPTNFVDMPAGMIQCTTAHYMDVGPTTTTSSAQSVGEDSYERIGLYVKGHTDTESYLKMFISDTFLREEMGLTNVYDATNMLAGFVQHFDTNNIPIDTPVQVTASFTRIAGGTNILYDYDGNGVGESGFELRFDFEFQSGVSAMMGLRTTPSYTLADPAMVDSAGNWYVWFSGSGYQRGGPWSLGVSGTPVAADFDGDLYSDCAIVDSTGAWRAWFTSQGYRMGGPWNLGISGTPVAADFDGDLYGDPAVVDSTDAWYIWFTSLGYQMGGPYYFLGGSGTPVAADFDGDLRADPAMVDSTGAWCVWFSSLAYRLGGPYSLGVIGTPVAADYDADGYADPAVVDSTGTWRVWFTSQGYQMAGPFALGIIGTPLAADFDGR